MTKIAQARLAGATALIILLYLLQVALFASPSQADTHTHEDPGYWEALYPNAVGCWAGGGADHGELVDGGLAVELMPFEDDWVGDRWEVLIVNGGPEDGGDGHGNAIYELPVAGQAYYAPNDGGDQPAVNHWIVCKGETPTEPGVAAVAVHAECVWDENQAYFYADVLENASLLVDLTGDDDFNDTGAGEKAVVPGNPGFIYPDTPAGGSIAWEATANPGFEFDGGETVVGGSVTVPDCTSESTTPTNPPTTPTTSATTVTTATTATTTVVYDSLPEGEEQEEDGAAVLGATITTAPQEVSADTLPFTGFASGDAALLGLLAIVGGGLMLFVGRRSDDEEAGAPLGTWSTF